MSDYVSKFYLENSEVLIKDSEARTLIDTANDNIETNASDITDLKNTSARHSDSINNLNTQTASINNSLSSVSSRISDTESNVSTLNDEVIVLSNRMDGFSSLPSGSTAGDAELIDIRTGYEGTVYSSAGDSVRGQAKELSNFLYNISERTGKLVSQYVENGYYSTVNGSKQSGGSYKRTPYLIPAEPNTYYISNQGDVYCSCFDANKTYLGRCICSNRTAKGKIEPTLANTAYVGLYQNNATGFYLYKLDSSEVKVVEYPYSDENYIRLEQCWINANGAVATATNLDLIILQNVKAGEKYYISNDASSNGWAFDANKQSISTTYETRGTGRIYTVPEGACTMYFNMYRNRTDGFGHMSDYITKISDGKILAVGDSITWLEGHANYGGMEYVTGWQKQLRKLGYDVVNYAFSGYPYAEGVDVVEGVSYSLYKEIVTNQANVSDYKYIILFGGTNDVLYSSPVGNRTNSYEASSFDSTTFNGALSAIIDYIRSHNSTCKIILASFPKSQASARTFVHAYPYVQELEYNAEFWSCQYVDIFKEMNVQPYTDGFSYYFYDDTHPNFYGMERIGEIFAKRIM